MTSEISVVNTLQRVTNASPISHGDILSIGISKAEEKILENLKTVEAALIEFSKEEKALEKKLDTVATKIFSSYTSKADISSNVEKINKSFKKFVSDKFPGCNSSHPKIILKSNKASIVETLKLPNNKKTEFVFTQDFMVEGGTVYQVAGLARSETKFEISKDDVSALRGVFDQLDKLYAERNSYNEERVKWNRKLADLPRLQRSMQRAFAETALKSAEGGKEVLDLIQLEVEKLIAS